MARGGHLYAIDGDFEHSAEPSGQAMPCDLEAERAILGAVMVSSRAAGTALLLKLRDQLDGSDFYLPGHELIWNSLCELSDASCPTDPVSVADHLGTAELAKLGGGAYLHTCLNAVITPENSLWHAQIVKDLAAARSTVTVGARLMQIGRTPMEHGDLRGIVRAAVQPLLDIGSRNWPALIPLRTTRKLPPFPIKALPTWLQAQVEAVAHETQTPQDLAATVGLSVLATAAGGKIRVNVQPKLGWTEPTNLFTVAALPPGTRKSPVFKAMLRPLVEAEKALIKRAETENIEAGLHRQIAEKKANHAAETALKASSGELHEAVKVAASAAAELSALKEPVQPKLFTGSVTVEELASLLYKHGGRMAILSAESEIFSIMAGRYSAGSPAFDVFLAGHAGDIMRTDRKGRSSEAVDEPALTVGICTQPAALAALAEIKGADERGLVPRFLFTVPECRIGFRDVDPQPRDPAIHATYQTNIYNLILSLEDLHDPRHLDLAPESRTMFIAISQEYEERMRPGADLADMQAWSCKAAGACMRIAGLLHIARHYTTGYDRPIDVDTVIAAYDLIRYYTEHTMAAYDVMTIDVTADRSQYILEWIERTGGTCITARDILVSASRSRFSNVKEVEPALALLEQHNYLRRRPQPPSTPRGGRPPAPSYDVNPIVGGS
jgi:replicative DNA helicase